MKTACTNCMIPGENLIEKADKLRKWGFDGISMQIDDSLRSNEMTEQILTLTEKTGVAICEFSYLGKYFGHHMCGDADIQAKALRYFDDSIEICRAVGAVTGIGYEYKAQDPLPLFETDKKMPPETEAVFLDILQTVGRKAKAAGVQLVLEAINRYETRYVNNLADCRTLIDKVRDVCEVGIIADTFHLAIEERDIAQSIVQSRGYIKEVHLGDNNRLLPGYGSIDWKAFFRALKEIEYRGYVTLECGVPGDAEAALPECAAFLHKMITQA